MEEHYKDYDPKQYKGVGIIYTVSVLEEKIKELEKAVPFISNKAVNEIKANILELKNNVAFLKQYR